MWLDYLRWFTDTILVSANLAGAIAISQSIGSPCYDANTTLPSDFDLVAKFWKFAHDCDFTPDASYGVKDIKQMSMQAIWKQDSSPPFS